MIDKNPAISSNLEPGAKSKLLHAYYVFPLWYSYLLLIIMISPLHESLLEASSSPITRIIQIWPIVFGICFTREQTCAKHSASSKAGQTLNHATVNINLSIRVIIFWPIKNGALAL